MKKGILMFLFSLMAVSAMAQVNFFEGTIEEALAKGKAEGKNVIVMFTLPNG